MSAAINTSPSAVPDLDGLYRSSAARLASLVRHEVGAPDAVVEDACQSAWTKLAFHRDGVARESAFSWLATTARREALRSVARAERELSLEASVEEGALPDALQLPEAQQPDGARRRARCG